MKSVATKKIRKQFLSHSSFLLMSDLGSATLEKCLTKLVYTIVFVQHTCTYIFLHCLIIMNIAPSSETNLCKLEWSQSSYCSSSSCWLAWSSMSRTSSSSKPADSGTDLGRRRPLNCFWIITLRRRTRSRSSCFQYL
jgi:hypothetical protein